MLDKKGKNRKRKTRKELMA